MKISDRVTSFLKENFISPTSHLLCEKSREKSEKSFWPPPPPPPPSKKEGGGGGGVQIWTRLLIIFIHDLEFTMGLNYHLSIFFW